MQYGYGNSTGYADQNGTASNNLNILFRFRCVTDIHFQTADNNFTPCWDRISQIQLATSRFNHGRAKEETIKDTNETNISENEEGQKITADDRDSEEILKIKDELELDHLGINSLLLKHLNLQNILYNINDNQPNLDLLRARGQVPSNIEF